MPFEDATLSKEALGGGRASVGHGEGNSLSLTLRAIAWKPIRCQTISNEGTDMQKCLHLHLSVFP